MLLLGGGGFIGSALARRLLQERIPVHTIGCQNVDSLADVLPRCSTVVHLASGTTPGSSALHPSLELNNLALTLRLLDLLQDQPQIHLIFFSSGGAVYGNPARLPVTEDCAIAPLSPYGAGKAAQEAFCIALRAKGHPVTIVRPSNAYGPGQTMRHGFGLVRTMLEHARMGKPLEIWGDGENVRDYIYIKDVVEACLRLIELPRNSGTYNLGNGVGCSINQLKRVVEKICGVELAIVNRPARDTDVREIVLDTSLLHRELSWFPAVKLAEGLGSTWQWLRTPL